MTTRQAYLPTLEALLKIGVHYQLMGTGALKLYHPAALASDPLHEFDALLYPTHDNLLKLIHCLLERGWSITSWGEPWDPTWTEAHLKGRWYVRARQGDLQIDATYECPFLNMDDLRENVEWIDGLPVCPEEDLWYLKLLKDWGECLTYAEQYGLAVPDTAKQRAQTYKASQL
ncbi:MAG: hypothetical protein AAFV53_34070 [Myxococcota bacterium]